MAKRPFFARLLPACLSLLFLSSALGQSAPIAYQGRLTEAGRLATGSYDLQFKLFDAAAAGVQRGDAIAKLAVPVAEGVFTVTLDFGGAVFDGSPRFLEIGVKAGGSASPYTTLAPRQQVASIPYAIQSLNAATATTAISVATGSAVTSVNNLKDHVTLAAGPNVTITPNGNTLTIGATATGGSGGSLWERNLTDAYFNGGNVGIGTSTPSGRLHVHGGWDSEQGALQLSGQRPTLRFTGDADSGNESWLLHLGGAGLGNLGFYRRAGPGTWNPVMQLTTSGPQMEIYGQDTLGLIGFQPFLTLFDSSAGFAASRIQAGNGDLILETASYVAGRFDTGLVLKNNTGNVGIGTLAPVAKLHAETSEVKSAVYGNATGPGTGVHGRSTTGVAVLADATGAGIGVWARSTTGVAVLADGDARQARDKGGFVKAMALIDPFLPADQYVVRCYNPYPQGGNATSTAPCGIKVTRSGRGRYEIDFGFDVGDRFISATALGDSCFLAAGSVTATPNVVYVSIDHPEDRFIGYDAAFYIFVF